jgi:hypothetical protein
MTGKDEVFIDMIEFALDWGFVPSSKDMKKYNRLIERRRLDAVQSARRKAIKPKQGA